MAKKVDFCLRNLPTASKVTLQSSHTHVSGVSQMLIKFHVTVLFRPSLHHVDSSCPLLTPTANNTMQHVDHPRSVNNTNTYTQAAACCARPPRTGALTALGLFRVYLANDL